MKGRMYMNTSFLRMTMALKLFKMITMTLLRQKSSNLLQMLQRMTWGYRSDPYTLEEPSQEVSADELSQLEQKPPIAEIVPPVVHYYPSRLHWPPEQYGL